METTGKGRVGTETFDDFLAEQGILEECEEVGIKRDPKTLPSLLALCGARLRCGSNHDGHVGAHGAALFHCRQLAIAARIVPRCTCTVSSTTRP